MAHPAKPRVPLQGSSAPVHTHTPDSQGGKPKTAKGTSEPRKNVTKFGTKPGGTRGSRRS